MRAEGLDPLAEKQGAAGSRIPCRRQDRDLRQGRRRIMSRLAKDSGRIRNVRRLAIDSFRNRCKAINHLPSPPSTRRSWSRRYLDPFWSKAPVAAKRSRLRIEAVLEAARVKGLRRMCLTRRAGKGRLDKLFHGAGEACRHGPLYGGTSSPSCRSVMAPDTRHQRHSRASDRAFDTDRRAIRKR